VRPRGPRERATDVLAGNWYDPQNNYFLIVKQGGAYTLTGHGGLGQTATGTATLSGNLVRLDITDVVVGRYTVELRLSGDTMQGTIRVMGFPMPLVLTRH